MTLRGANLLLGLAVFISALGVVFTQHHARQLFVGWQGLQDARDELNVEWGRLQLEQSTWSTHGRIETVARDKLNMQIPPAGAVVIVTP